MKRYNIPVFIPHEGCPHSCVFCNQRKITGVQTTVTTDDVRGIIKEYLSFLPKDGRYVEVAFFGGSFTGLDLNIQEEFLKVANEFISEINGIRMSTRPDYIDDEVLSLCKKYNVKTIELGLQSSNDEVLRMNEREHIFKQTIEAANLIKEYNISLGLQMMIGMYGSNPERDLKTAYDVAELCPECVRIYPTLTLSNTKLETLYKEGRYIPYSLDEAIDVTDKVMNVFEDRGIEIIRVGLHSDESLTDGESIVAGPYHPAFRELVLSKRMREKIEEDIIRKNIHDCEVLVEEDNNASIIMGHKKANAKYFKEKYNIDIKIKNGMD